MKKTILPFILCAMIFGSNGAIAQREFSQGSKPSFKDRVYFGGSFGAQFGDITFVELSPVMGFMIKRNLSAGVGITYRYYKDNRTDYTTNIYGGRLFARQNITFMKLPLFLYAEYEYLGYEYLVDTNPDGSFNTRRVWVPGLLIGGGYYQRIGNRAGFMVAILWNVIYDDRYTPYRNPVVRVGLTF